jgi:hypothetical protein
MTVLARVAICAAIIASSASEAAAQSSTKDDNSANAVYSGCKAFAQGLQPSNSEVATLGSYCSGMLHALAGIAKFVSPQYALWRSCPPPTSDAAQLARVVVKFVEEHPERMHEDFRVLAVEALHRAWPCN